MTDVTVVVVAKECLPGKVKTRLTPALTPEGAARVASAALADTTIETVRALPASRRVLLYDGVVLPEGTDDFEVLHRSRRTRRAPRGDVRRDDRSDAARRHGHAAGLAGAPRAGLRGPGARRVVRPADDGGFWSLYLREPDGALLRGVPMSQDDTGAVQLARLTDAGLSVGTLPALLDVDTVADAEQVAALAPTSRFATAFAAERDTTMTSTTEVPDDDARHRHVRRRRRRAVRPRPADRRPPAPDRPGPTRRRGHDGRRRWSAAADRVDRSLLEGADGPVIDIGCGPGRMLVAARALGIPSLGVDVSAEAVAIARRSGDRGAGLRLRHHPRRGPLGHRARDRRQHRHRWRPVALLAPLRRDRPRRWSRGRRDARPTARPTVRSPRTWSTWTATGARASRGPRSASTRCSARGHRGPQRSAELDDRRTDVLRARRLNTPRCLA